MKHNWEYKRLGDICKILNGYAFKSSNYISNGGLRIIRIANVQEGFVCDNAPQFYPLDTIPSLSKYILYIIVAVHPTGILLKFIGTLVPMVPKL